jgi:hypothetical protein
MIHELSQCESVLAHFERMLMLVRRLTSANVHVHAQEYDFHSFGSWTLIAGTYRHRFRFAWNGRNRLLTVEEAFLSTLKNCELTWKQLRAVEHPPNQGGAAFDFVERFFAIGALNKEGTVSQ